MNKPADKEAKLLAETFHEEWTAGAPAAFARAAAAHARNRRRMRQGIAATVGGIAMAAVCLAVWPRRATPLPPVAPSMVPPPVAARGYEIISDDELLAQLRDHPVLVVKRTNGTKEITLLEPAVENGAFDE